MESNSSHRDNRKNLEGNDRSLFLTNEFYSDFEDRFRGTPEEIGKRQSIYLPILEKAEIYKSQAPILDIGCGRGEWLSLLGQHGYRARGVDHNEKFVHAGEKKGLDIVSEEALQYLISQAAESFSAVTAFHLVEHLPFAQIIKVINEVFRTLRPGGLLILETPNPENLFVGACSFYQDPSHLSPIPPSLLVFIAERAGFPSPYVARVNAEVLGPPLPYLPREAPFSMQLNAAIHLLNQNFYASPDYAIITQKCGGSAEIFGSPELNSLGESAPMDIMYFRKMEAEAKALEAEAKMHEAEVRAQEAGIKALEAGTRALEAEAKVGQAETQIRRVESELQILLESRSWRLTAPLRSIHRLFRAFWGSPKYPP